MKLGFFVLSLILVCAVVRDCGCKPQKSRAKSSLSPELLAEYNRNPFFKYLKEKNVNFLAHPIKVKDTCHWEFSNHGSICQISSLREYSIRDKKKIMRQVKRILRRIKKLSITLDTTVKTSNLLFKLMPNNNKSYLLRLLQKPEFKDFSKIVDATKNQTLANDINTCWEQMADIRSRSLCSACSARYMIYFRDEKALITDKICKKVLKKCTDSFSYFLSFLEAMRKFGSTIKSGMKLKKKKMGKYLSAAVNNMITVTDKIRNKGISLHMHQYKYNRAGHPEAAWNLCSSFINLASDSFMKQLNTLFGRYRISFFSSVTWSYKKELKRFYKFIKPRKEIHPTHHEHEGCQSHENHENQNCGNASNQGCCGSLCKGASSEVESKSTAACERKLNSLEELKTNWQTSLQGPTTTNSTVPFFNVTSFTDKFLTGDVQVMSSLPVEKKVDSAYTSYLGAYGTSKNEAIVPIVLTPMNMSCKFP